MQEGTKTLSMLAALIVGVTSSQANATLSPENWSVVEQVVSVPSVSKPPALEVFAIVVHSHENEDIHNNDNSEYSFHHNNVDSDVPSSSIGSRSNIAFIV